MQKENTDLRDDRIIMENALREQHKEIEYLKTEIRNNHLSLKLFVNEMRQLKKKIEEAKNNLYVQNQTGF